MRLEQPKIEDREIILAQKKKEIPKEREETEEKEEQNFWIEEEINAKWRK